LFNLGSFAVAPPSELSLGTVLASANGASGAGFPPFSALVIEL